MASAIGTSLGSILSNIEQTTFVKTPPNEKCILSHSTLAQSSSQGAKSRIREIEKKRFEDECVYISFKSCLDIKADLDLQLDQIDIDFAKMIKGINSKH